VVRSFTARAFAFTMTRVSPRPFASKRSSPRVRLACGMRADRDAILDYLDDYLEIDRFKDYNPKGLQVQGAPEVRKIVTGVSANMDFFREALAVDGNFLLVHHGMFWKNESQVVKGPLKDRLKFLLDNDITLAGYHLPLDAHPVVGNNALALKDWGAVDLEPWGDVEGTPIGWKGRLPEPLRAPTFFEKLNAYYEREALVFPHGPENVETVAVVSGGAQGYARQAVEDGLDCFITGEVSEWVMSTVKEGGVHFVSAGHYATERVGIRALGEHVAERFGVPHEFIDVPNPV
jgi:dinuclear metal center YbgI/SA1388 family protein